MAGIEKLQILRHLGEIYIHGEAGILVRGRSAQLIYLSL